MTEIGWRTVTVEQRAALSLSDGCLCVTAGEEVREIPLEQIGTLLITSQQASVTSALLTELIERGIRVVFCNRRHHPAFELQDYGTHTFAAGRLREQADWKEERKDLLWERIVSEKIRMQQAVLDFCVPSVGEALAPCLERLSAGDPANAEGQAAKIYFHRLFGFDFSRSDETDINAALNYGYAILLSSFNQAIALMGYHPALGIHHHSVTNPFNLGCDLMEPFRPFVDAFVWRHRERKFDAAFRLDLVRLLYEPVRYGGAKYELRDAIGQFTEDCLRFICEKRTELREVALAG